MRYSERPLIDPDKEDEDDDAAAIARGHKVVELVGRQQSSGENVTRPVARFQRPPRNVAGTVLGAPTRRFDAESTVVDNTRARETVEPNATQATAGLVGEERYARPDDHRTVESQEPTVQLTEAAPSRHSEIAAELNVSQSDNPEDEERKGRRRKKIPSEEANADQEPQRQTAGAALIEGEVWSARHSKEQEQPANSLYAGELLLHTRPGEATVDHRTTQIDEVSETVTDVLEAAEPSVATPTAEIPVSDQQQEAEQDWEAVTPESEPSIAAEEVEADSDTTDDEEEPAPDTSVVPGITTNRTTGGYARPGRRRRTIWGGAAGPGGGGLPPSGGSPPGGGSGASGGGYNPAVAYRSYMANQAALANGAPTSGRELEHAVRRGFGNGLLLGFGAGWMWGRRGKRKLKQELGKQGKALEQTQTELQSARTEHVESQRVNDRRRAEQEGRIAAAESRHVHELHEAEAAASKTAETNTTRFASVKRELTKQVKASEERFKKLKLLITKEEARQADQTAERLEAPDKHRFQQSEWLTAELDDQGRVVRGEDSVIDYGQEYHHERAQETRPKPDRRAAGGVALMGTVTSNAAKRGSQAPSLPGIPAELPPHIPNATTQGPPSRPLREGMRSVGNSLSDSLSHASTGTGPLWPWMVALVVIVISLIFLLA